MPIYIRTSNTRVGPAGIGAAVLLLMIGGAIVLSGLALLLALGTVAATVGAAVVLFRRITGRASPALSARRAPGLDRSLEVFPPEPATVRPLEPGTPPPVSDQGDR